MTELWKDKDFRTLIRDGQQKFLKILDIGVVQMTNQKKNENKFFGKIWCRT